MRSKAIPRKRKVEQTLAYSQEEWNNGSPEENRQPAAETSTNVALHHKQQHNGKSKKKRKRRKSLNTGNATSTSNSEMWELNQDDANKQTPMTPVQEFGALTVEKKDVPLPLPSMDTSDFSSLISQPVHGAFCFPPQSLGSVLGFSGTNISQALPQASGFSTTIPFDRAENDVVSLRGKGIPQSGSRVKLLAIPQELIQRWWQSTAAKTSASKQKAKVTINPFLSEKAVDTTCKLYKPGIAGSCERQDNGQVRKSTKHALRRKVQSGKKSGNTGNNGKCLTIHAEVSSSETLEQKQEHLVTDKKTPLVQQSMDSLACQSLKSQPVQQTTVNVVFGLREIKPSQTLRRAPEYSAKISSEQCENNVISLRREEIPHKGAGEIASDIQQERIQLLSRRNAKVVDEPLTVRSEQAVSETMEQRDIDRFVPETVLETRYKRDKPGISEYCVERDKFSVRKSTKDALRQDVLSNRKACKIVKNGKTSRKSKAKSVEPKKLKQINSEQDLKGEMKKYIDSTVKKRKTQNTQPSMDSLVCPSQVSQSLQQSLRLSTTLPCAQVENNVVTLGDKRNSRKGAGEMRLEGAQEHIWLQKNAAENGTITLDNKNLSKYAGQIRPTAKEHTVKLGQRKSIATSGESLEQIKEEEEKDDAGDDGNFPDFSKLLL